MLQVRVSTVRETKSHLSAGGKPIGSMSRSWGESMLKTSVRRAIVLFVATMLASAVALSLGVAPAHAAASGKLLNKGPGSLYSDVDNLNLGAVPGGTPATFFHKVVNTGSAPQQFKVAIHPGHGTINTTLFHGSTAVPNPYYTPPIPPGGALVLSVKATAPAGTPQGNAAVLFALQDPETNSVLELSFDSVYYTYQSGTTRNDIFLKYGTQPYVGGSFSEQVEMSNAVRPGNTVTFLLRLKNNGFSAAAMTLESFLFGGCLDLIVTVKQGTKNVTSAVAAGTYTTGTLAPGAKRDLKVLFKLPSTSSCTSATYYTFTASGPDRDVRVFTQVSVAS